MTAGLQKTGLPCAMQEHMTEKLSVEKPCCQKRTRLLLVQLLHFSLSISWNTGLLCLLCFLSFKDDPDTTQEFSWHSVIVLDFSKEKNQYLVQKVHQITTLAGDEELWFAF